MAFTGAAQCYTDVPVMCKPCSKTACWADVEDEEDLFRALSTSSTTYSTSSATCSSPVSASSAASSSDSDDDEQAAVLGLFPMAKPTHGQRTQLNANAPEFVWNGQPASRAPAVDVEINMAMKEVMSALAVSDVTVQVERVWEQQGWSIIATLPANGACYKEWLLTQAKETLLDHAEQSSGLFVLSSTAQPFTPTVSGFVVALWSTEEKDSACWDSVSKGYCRRGRCCNWKHPSNVTSIHIRVAMAWTV